MIKSALIGAATGLAVFAITATVMLLPVHADPITRQIGLEILKEKMIEHNRSINWTPPGYFLVGYTVRVG